MLYTVAVFSVGSLVGEVIVLTGVQHSGTLCGYGGISHWRVVGGDQSSTHPSVHVNVFPRNVLLFPLRFTWPKSYRQIAIEPIDPSFPSLSLYIYPSLSILFGAPPPRCTIAHVPWRILENFSVDILVLSMGVGDNYRLLGNHGWKFYERKKCDGDKSFVGDRILIK